MRDKEKKELEIKEIAHRIWVEAGCPNGDVRINVGSSLEMSLKESHWHQAVMEWTYGPDYMRSW